MAGRLQPVPGRSAGRPGPVAAVIFLVAIALSQPGLAHGLSVFAWVEGGDLIVEGKFSNGRRPAAGRVTVYDGHDRLLLTTDLSGDGSARFPLPDSNTGLKIDLSTGGGHDAYWILTPFDIDSQRQAPATGGDDDAAPG